MIDLISKKEVFTTIENVIAEYNKYTYNQKEAVFLSNTKDEIFSRLDDLEIKKPPYQDEWINVEDKLPEDYEVVLIYENGSLGIAEYKLSEFFHLGITFKPTHWKPIYLPLIYR